MESETDALLREFASVSEEQKVPFAEITVRGAVAFF